MTQNGLSEAQQRKLADEILWRALVLMQEAGIPFAMMMDRVLTAAGAHIAHHEGAQRAEQVFRGLADNIHAGVLAPVEKRGLAN